MPKQPLEVGLVPDHSDNCSASFAAFEEHVVECRGIPRAELSLDDDAVAYDAAHEATVTPAVTRVGLR